MKLRALILALAVGVALALFLPAAALSGPGTFSCSSGTCTWGYNYMGQNLNTPLDAGWNYWAHLYSNHTNGDSYDIGWATAANGYWCKTTMGPMSSVDVTPSVWGCGGYLFQHTVWDQGSPYFYAEVNT